MRSASEGWEAEARKGQRGWFPERGVAIESLLAGEVLEDGSLQYRVCPTAQAKKTEAPLGSEDLPLWEARREGGRTLAEDHDVVLKGHERSARRGEAEGEEGAEVDASFVEAPLQRVEGEEEAKPGGGRELVGRTRVEELGPEGGVELEEGVRRG